MLKYACTCIPFARVQPKILIQQGLGLCVLDNSKTIFMFPNKAKSLKLAMQILFFKRFFYSIVMFNN
jgi:hypothetical protein